MSTAMQLFGTDAAVPAHIAAAFAESANVQARDTVPALTFRGKTWRLRLDGEETVLTRTNSDGESEPTPIVKMVVLDINMKRSRTFFEGAYVEGANTAPTCWATDGERPDADVPAPVAKTCASCPNSVKGSKITTNGKETTACATVKRLAVVPAAKLDMTPLLLKVPQTSMWDKNNAEAEAKGYFAWDQYVDFLRQRGVTHTAAVVTKIKFDPNVAYPKLLFTAERWLESSESLQVVPLIGSEGVKKLLSGKINDTAPAEPAAPSAPAATPKAAAKPVLPPPPPKAPAVVADEDDGDDGFSTAPAAPAAVAPKPAKPPKAAAPAAPAPPPAPKIPATTAAGNPDLAALAAAWDD